MKCVCNAICILTNEDETFLHFGLLGDTNLAWRLLDKHAF